tara:strand:- start:121 stop:987 length:867 start_codon:yes stop_codon:yes gene_type:complete
MQTIIGLGQAGCNIADKFAEYPQYKVYKIDAGLEKAPRCFNFPKYDHPEKYEENCPNVKDFFKNVKGEILFITSCGFVSAASLRILEQIKHKCDINVLYVRPDKSLLSELKSLNDRVLFNVFQQYARSGLFKKIYLVDNVCVSDIVGDVPLREYFNSINQLVVSTMHMINVFDNSEAEIQTFAEPVETARILTFSMLDYKKSEEKMFFNVDIPRDKRYYYGVPENTLQTDGTLLKKITEQLKSLKQYDKMKVSYGIYSTNYEDIYIYGLLRSSVIQNDNFRLDKEINL